MENNQSKRGDELARRYGATKYVEWSFSNDWGLKKLFDEIAFTYFANLKDEEERNEEENWQKRMNEAVNYHKKMQEVNKYQRYYSCDIL